MTLRLGELFAGYGGLGMAVEEVFGAETAWFSEFEDAPSKILAHHWPTVPNHGDITRIDWAAVEPVDIISGGSPCQDLSLAGRRKGMTEGTRSNLWESMREAIATIQPTYVVWENVRGALSAKAISASDLEPGQGPMGDRNDGHLRALGRVLGDLASLGYDCQWRGLRAADVGAPHGRFRIFLLAKRRDATPHPRSFGRNKAIQHYGSGAASHDRASLPHQSNSDSLRAGPERETASDPVRGGSGRRAAEPRPTRRHYAVIGSGARGSWARAALANTHRGYDAGREQDQERCAERRAATQRPSRSGGRGETPTDTSRNESERRGIVGVMGSQTGTSKAHGQERQRVRETPSNSSPGTGTNWGPYAPAIRRWEALRGAAPSPTELTPKGKHRLSAAFAEWLMGVDPGWITDVPGISRNDQLKACGNGVVPQQATAALRDMLAAFERTAA